MSILYKSQAFHLKYKMSILYKSQAFHLKYKMSILYKSQAFHLKYKMSILYKSQASDRKYKMSILYKSQAFHPKYKMSILYRHFFQKSWYLLLWRLPDKVMLLLSTIQTIPYLQVCINSFNGPNGPNLCSNNAQKKTWIICSYLHPKNKELCCIKKEVKSKKTSVKNNSKSTETKTCNFSFKFKYTDKYHHHTKFS